MSYQYNPWPIGHVPKELQRTEPEEIKKLGYEWNDPREIVDLFEAKVAEFAGSKYAVAVDSCTHALELSFRYLLYKERMIPGESVIIPSHTYVSVYNMLKQLGFMPEFYADYALLDVEEKWSGVYYFFGTGVVDGAVRWKQGMYEEDSLHCLSFQIKKRIPIGRGGMILTDDKEAADWLKLASYDGRDLKTPYTDPDHVKLCGYHYYMTPEDAARGILLMDAIHEEGDTGSWQNYPNVKEMLKL
jgi:dTDP-4-amino-4,6-dideoxygalactose transaminase